MLAIKVIVYTAALILVGCTAALEQQKCPLISDKDAEIYRSWFFVFKDKQHLADKFGAKPLSKPLSQCLAAIRPGVLIPWKKAHLCALAGIHFRPHALKFWRRDRSTLVEPFETLKNEFSNLVNGLKDGKLAEPFENTRRAIQGIPTEDYQKNCDAFETKLNPCVLRVVELFIQHANENECCEAYRKEFEQTMGATLSFEFFQSLFYAVQDIGCAKRQDATTCGHQLAQTLFNTSLKAVIPNALVAVQIPDEEACKAFNAEPFRPTTGSKPYEFETNVGCCANYLDIAFTFFSRIPMLRQILSDDMFLPGRCRAVSSGFCPHLPNHFSKSCSFNSTCSAKSDSLNLDVFLPTPPMTAAPTSNPTPTPEEELESEAEVVSYTPIPSTSSVATHDNTPRQDAPDSVSSAKSNNMGLMTYVPVVMTLCWFKLY